MSPKAKKAVSKVSLSDISGIDPIRAEASAAPRRPAARLQRR